VQTWLFVPGNQPERIRKACATQADRIIIDWEDSVAAEHKANARQATAEALSAEVLCGNAAVHSRIVIRINPAGSHEHGRDIDAAARIRPAAVMLARTEHPEMTIALSEHGLDCIALIESALGVEQAFSIASMPGVEGLAFGCVDYLADIQARHSLTALHFAQSRLVNAARAAGLQHIIDGPVIDLSTPEKLATEALHAQALGFSGKMAIHPQQVLQMRQLFQASDAELAHAREIIRVYEQGLRQGQGVIRHGDLMIDGAVAKQAQWILEAAAQ
jgi:citrate lyase subunit beta / citryl-CoA lyase